MPSKESDVQFELHLTLEQKARVQALKDAVDIAECRKKALVRYGARLGVEEALDEVVTFLKAELERAEMGVSIPGNPGSKSTVGG